MDPVSRPDQQKLCDAECRQQAQIDIGQVGQVNVLGCFGYCDYSMISIGLLI